MDATTIQTENKVAVGCLSCYNDGRLTYEWMNADELEEAYEGKGLAQTVCKQPVTIYHNPEEWEIQDYDGDIGRLRLGGWPNIENLIQMMRLMDDDPARYVPVYEAACDRYESPTADEVEQVADMMMYVGDQSLEDYFMEQAIDCDTITEDSPMFSYIDWEHYARDQMFHYDRFDYGGDTYLLPNY
jgi:antirestriction protein